MRHTVSTWSEFQKVWSGNVNFLLSKECVPFQFILPAPEVVIDTVRNDPDARITPGIRGESLNLNNIANEFRKKTLHEVMHSKFTIAHFKLSNFYRKGQIFFGFEEQVMDPWVKKLSEAGFTWDRCYPILFISGPECATNYHMDQSHVVAWQMYGTKTFNSLRNPESRSPLAERLKSVEFGNQKTVKPFDLEESEILSYSMSPGTVLWNAFLTPHWVEASNGLSYSINISHGGLRFKGNLCQHEQELENWRKEVALKTTSSY